MNYLQQFYIQIHILGLLWFASELQLSVSTPPPGYVKKPDTDLHPPKYEFGYEVKDGGGGKQGHLEARDGVYALGKYYVRLPDGSDQKVNYFADDWGYHPLVEYNSASPSSSSSAQFAMGEKAVAALVKTLSNAKGTEVSNILQRLSHKEHSSSASSVKSSISESSGSPPYTASTSTLGQQEEYQQPQTVTITAGTPTTQQNTHSVIAPSLTTQGQAQTLYYQTEGSAGLTSSPYSTSEINSENIPQEKYHLFESQKYDFVRPQVVTSNYVDDTLQETTQRVVTIGGNSGYRSDSSKYSDSVTFQRPVHKGSVQITSYLANNEHAVDVSPNGGNKRLHSVPGGESGATTISAFLIAEDDRDQENLVSTTVSPIQKEPFGPIIVPNHPTGSGYYNGRISSTTESNQYRNSEGIRLDVNLSEERAHVSPTPAPTPEPVLVTPREQVAQLTSSDQVLAPIQAAVSMSSVSALKSSEDSVERDYNVKISESTEPVVEQQTLQEQSVYKTTIDVQKSIPFEITDDSNNYGNRVGQVDATVRPPPFQQGTYLPIHQSINLEFGKNNAQQTLAHKQHFLKQVLMAYQKLSNNNINNEESQQYNLPVTQLTPSVIPNNNLYYIYLQRYNPLLHRYGIQPQQPMFYQLPYQSALSASAPALIPNNFGYNQESGSYSQSSKFVQEPTINMGFSSYINHAPYSNQKDGQHNVKNGNNLENSIASYRNVENKSKFVIPQTYNVKILKEEVRNDDLQSRQNPETDVVIQSNLNQGYLNNPVNNIYASNLNTLSSSTYQNYVDSTNPPTTTEADHQQAFINNYNEASGRSLSNNRLITENKQLADIRSQTDLSYQTQQYSENGLGDNSKVNEFGYTVTLPNPTTVTELPLKLHNSLAVTKILPISYPQTFPLPQPVPLSYPQQVNIPVPQYLPYQQSLPLQFKDYQPLYVYTKKENYESQKKSSEENQQPPFKPSQKLYHSVYPPETYYVTEYLKTNSRSRGVGKKLCIEYGGFKPPLIPSVQISEKLEKLEKRSDKSV